MAKKRAQLLSRPERRRSDAREPVIIAGTCRIGARPAEDMLVLDLGAKGCQVRGNSLGVTKSEPVELLMGGIGPLAGKLKWVKSGSLGVAFDTALDEATLNKLRAMLAPRPNVVQLRGRSA